MTRRIHPFTARDYAILATLHDADVEGEFLSQHQLAVRVSERYGVPIPRNSIGAALARLGKEYGEAVADSPRGRNGKIELTHLGRVLAAKAARVCEIMDSGDNRENLPNAVKVVHLPHHTQLIARVSRGLRPSRAQIVATCMTPRQLGGQSFDSGAFGGLRTSTFNIAIGTPPHSQPPQGRDFQTDPLYITQMEAMVPVDFPADSIPLLDLVDGAYRLLLPPDELNSRRWFEQFVTKHCPPDVALRARRSTFVGFLDPDDVVVDERFPLDIQVLLVHAWTAAAGRWNGHVVVAPSDSAHQFKDGQAFAGDVAARFRWVPVVVDTDKGLTHIAYWVAQTYVRRTSAVHIVLGTVRRAAQVWQPDLYTGPKETSPAWVPLPRRDRDASSGSVP